MGRPRIFALIITALLAAFALFPWLGLPIYFVSVLFVVFMYVVLATSWNIIGGFAGYLSFGHVAFFGIGAYATGLMMKGFHLSALGTVLSCIPAGIIAALVAVIIGYPCLRLRGPYFAVITFCFAFVVELGIKNLDILGGPEGLWLKSMDLPIGVTRAILYEIMLAIVVFSVAFAFWMSRAKFGAGLRAIKEDEEVAGTMCINAQKLKIRAFAMSAFFPGMAGGIYAYYLTYIHPDIVFDVNISILVVLMALFGGGGTWLGPVIGAVILTLVNEGLSTFVRAEFARIIYGCLFIIIITFMPNGIMEFFSKKQPQEQRKNIRNKK